MHVDVKIHERLESKSATYWKKTEDVLQVTLAACRYAEHGFRVGLRLGFID